MITPPAPGDRVTVPLEVSGVIAEFPGTVVRIVETSGTQPYALVRLDPEELSCPLDVLRPLIEA